MNVLLSIYFNEKGEIWIMYDVGAKFWLRYKGYNTD